MFGHKSITAVVPNEETSNISEEDLIKLHYYLSNCVDIGGANIENLSAIYANGELKMQGKVDDERSIRLFTCTGHYDNGKLDLRFAIAYENGDNYSTNEIIDFNPLLEATDDNSHVIITSFLPYLDSKKGIVREIVPYAFCIEHTRTH